VNTEAAGSAAVDSRAGAGRQPAPRGFPAPTWVALAAIVVVGGVVPLVVSGHFGALDIPRNDDWSYLRSAFQFADHGTIDGNGWASMNLVGQLLLATPIVALFGHHVEPLQIEVAVLGVLGLVAVFDLGKRLVTAPQALFVTLMVAVGPLWANLATTFMTDVPAFALAMICLALGARALRGDDLDVPLYSASLVVGLFAFSVREYALVAPVAVALAAMWVCRHRVRARARLSVAGLAGLVLAALVFFVWRRGLPGFSDFTPATPDPSSLRSAFQLVCQSAVLLGALVAPAALLARPICIVRTAWARAPRTSALLAFVTAGALVVESARHWSSGAFLGPGDYVMPSGALGPYTASGTRPDLFPKAVLALVAAAGIASAVVVVLAVVPALVDAVAGAAQGRLPAPTSPAVAVVGFAAVGFGLAFALPSVFRIVTFDRYLLPMVPLVGLLVLRTRRQDAHQSSRATIAGGIALAALALFGLVVAANSASFDGTKWALAEHVAREAGGPARVEGGFEWDDSHAGHEVFIALKRAPRPIGHYCVVLHVRDDRPHGPDVLRRARVWAPPGAETWLEATRRSC
jgi:hypothetical protein